MPKRVLLIDDDSVLRDGLAQSLALESATHDCA